MELDPGRKIAMPLWGLSAIVAFMAFGWLLASFLFGRIVADDLPRTISELGIEVFKSLFIGSSVGIVINFYLKHALGETPRATLRRSDIADIYASRSSAAQYLLQVIKNKRNRNIFIIGISLRDFLIGGGSLREVWHSLCERLEEEQKTNLTPKDRLHVKLLLLDPRSSEGRFRHSVEKETIGKAGLPFDVPHGLEEISRWQDIIFKSPATEFLQVRLYKHCTFAFILASDTEIVIEQYYYRDHSKRVSFPSIVYKSDSPKYGDLLYSFNKIWESAKEGILRPQEVGTASAIGEAGIQNIYRRDDRGLLATRQIDILQQDNLGKFVGILAITGRFYVDSPAAFEAIRKLGHSEVEIRFALVNPVSQQAILRTVADNSPPEEIRSRLREWSWEKHQQSRLYQDILHVVRETELWHEKGCKLQVRLYSCSVSCSLLFSENGPAFIEQYLYGRSKQFTEGRVLGGEYPVIEFQAFDGSEGQEEKIEREILSSAFNVVWNSFSLRVDQYRSGDEKAAFQKNHQRLLEELMLLHSNDTAETKPEKSEKKSKGSKDAGS